ncbi:MAG: hypothetical protein ACP5GU_00880 [Thermoprotei archaeon]|jgi:hypothetical protein
MKNRFIAAFLMIFILLEIPLYLQSVFASGNFTLVSTLWGSQSNPQKVYPGSSNVRFIVLIRNDYSNLVSVVGYLSLPYGFSGTNGGNVLSAVGYISTNNTIRYNINKGEIFELDYFLNIAGFLAPGTYYGNLTLNFTNSTFSNGNFTMNVPMTVSSFPTFNFQIISVYWSTTGGTIVNAVPGTRNVELNVILKNIGTDNINSISAQLILNKPFNPNKVMSSAQQVNKGSTFTLTFTGISIDFASAPGNYMEQLMINSTFIGYGGATSTYTNMINLSLVIGNYSNAGIQIVSVQWNGGEKVYSGSRKVSLDVVIQNMGSYTISNMLSRIILPSGFTNAYGSNIINTTSTAVLNYGNSITLNFSPIYIGDSTKPGIYYVRLVIMSVVSIDNTNLIAKDNFTIPIYVNDLITPIDLVSVDWSYNGNPAPALPGSQYVILSITFVNRGEDTYSGFQPRLILPRGFTVFGTSADPGPITPGSIFTVRSYVNVSDTVLPGNYIANLTLRFSVNPSGINTVGSMNFSIPLYIMDPKGFDTKISIVNAYWGTGTPNPVYPGSKNVPLTVEIVNVGLYTAQAVQIGISAPETFTPIINSTSVTSTLPSGSFASAVLYFDISPHTTPGSYVFLVNVKYFISVYGATIYRYVKFVFVLYVSQPTSGPPYINVVNSGWLNNYPVYPGTQNATFSLTINNEAPFPIAGIHLKLVLPRGFTPGVNGVESYIGGPIQQWQTASASFSINVNASTLPGLYTASLKIDYILLSGGNNLKNSEEKEIVLRVNSLKGFEYITYNWVGYAPNPGNVGATLIVLVRNTEVPTMKGIVAEIQLPKGFNSTITGTRVFNVTPYIFTSINQVQNLLQRTPVSSLQFMVPQQATQANLGDFLAIPISVSINKNVTPGYYPIIIKLNFLDQWNVVRNVIVNGDFWLPGSSNIIQVVEGKSKLLVGNRTAEINIYLRNNGSSSVYNVYVAITNMEAPISISSTVKYIPIIGPNSEVPVSWVVSVSPSISYLGSVPIVLSITFVDPAGFRHNITQTAILFIEGLAEIKFVDVTVEPKPIYLGSTITISATLINLGTYKAGNVEAWLEGNDIITLSNSYTFVGDIDVGSQIPISLSANISNKAVNKTIVYIVIKFKNVFNEITTERYPIVLNITYKPPQTQTQAQSLILPNVYELLIIVATVIFLSVSGYMIYLLYKKTKH